MIHFRFAFHAWGGQFGGFEFLLAFAADHFDGLVMKIDGRVR